MIDAELAVRHAHDQFGADGRLADPELRLRLEQLLGDIGGAREALAA